ncbi:MAG: alkaline phosphatase family protein [Actinobacteria bacterium]|nr:alkaline phosphatase family protein [Actinomycetota bacterium]
MKRYAALALAVLFSLAIPDAAPAYAPPPIRHVFVLVDENESARTTFAPGSPAPYLSQTLVSQGAFVPNYFGIGHASLDNYIGLVSGQAPNPKTSGDCPTFADFPAASLDASGQENGQGCVYPADVPTLMSQLGAAGLTWRAYEDGMGADPAREAATCGHPAVGAADNTEAATAVDQYAARHDPFVYFHSVIDHQAACDAGVVNLNRLPADLGSVATTPNYVFVTPNLCNDGHDAACANGGPGGLAQADAFLRTWVPMITSSPAFQQDGLLIVTFDEASGDSSACCGELPGPYDAANMIMPGGSGPGGGAVGAVLLSRFIAPGTRSAASYNHYALLGSVEDLLGLPRLAGAAGAAALGPDVYTRPTGVAPTPSPTPTPAPPTAPTPKPVVSLGSPAASVDEHGRATVTIDCRASRLACHGQLTITVTTGHKPKVRHVTAGQAGFSVPAGRRLSIRVKVTQPALTLLGRHRGALHTKATLTLSGATHGAASSLTLKRAVKH